MENLYKRLLPKVRDRLFINNEKYEVSVKLIIKDLKAVNFYTDLRMRTIHSLMIFSDTDPKDQWQLKWGDCFFKNDYEIKF
jgi:hypothetical protein